MATSIPAVINRDAGGAEGAERALAAVGGYEVHPVPAQEVVSRIQEIAASGPRRILVAGGDGSLCAAAHIVAARGVELAILPAGKLNHLAKHLGVPCDPRAPAE